MITKNAKFGKKDDVMLVEFGNGTVHMFNSIIKEDNQAAILFTDGKPMPLGKMGKDDYPDAKHSDDINLKLVIKFKNIASVDVLIDQLKDIKKVLKDDCDINE